MWAPGPGEVGASCEGAGHVLAGCEPGMLDHSPGTGEAAQVAVSARIAAALPGKDPGWSRPGRCAASHRERRPCALRCRPAWPRRFRVLDQPADAFKGDDAVRDHPGWVAQHGIEVAQDPPAGPDLPAADQLLADPRARTGQPLTTERSQTEAGLMAALQRWPVVKAEPGGPSHSGAALLTPNGYLSAHHAQHSHHPYMCPPPCRS